MFSAHCYQLAGSQDHIRSGCRTGSGLSTEARFDLGDLSRISAGPKRERSSKKDTPPIPGRKLKAGFSEHSPIC